MKKKKIFKIIKGVFNFVVGLVLICFVLAVCMQRFSNNKLSFMDYRIFTVITGSMEPKYVVGDVLLSKAVKPNELKIGDTVSYLGDEGNFSGKIVTHEVINIENDTNGKLLFHTKGVANLIEDPVVSEDQLYGKVVHKVALLSAIYKIVSTKMGMLLLVVIPLLAIITTEIIATMLDKEEERRAKQG